MYFDFVSYDVCIVCCINFNFSVSLLCSCIMWLWLFMGISIEVLDQNGCLQLIDTMCVD